MLCDELERAGLEALEQLANPLHPLSEARMAAPRLDRVEALPRAKLMKRFGVALSRSSFAHMLPGTSRPVHAASSLQPATNCSSLPAFTVHVPCV